MSVLRERRKAWEVDGSGMMLGVPAGVRLRVVVRGVSPLIVRTIEVPARVSLVQLHRILLACFGWSGECLHVFEIRAGRSRTLVTRC
jgi:hypothetical protein